MKKLFILGMLLLFSMSALADNGVKVVAWGTSSSADGNKSLEDFALKSGIGVSDLWIWSGKFSLSGYYLPNQNADLRFSFFAHDKWRLTAGFSQSRKWWDTSAGHETTPGGYAVANWFPNTNTIAPLSDRDELHTTRRAGFVQLDYLVTPLQKISLGYRRLTRDGRLTPFFRGFTFAGGVPFAATAASIRNYDVDGQEARLKANLSFGDWFLDIGAFMQSWDNSITNSLGTFGLTSKIGLTEIKDNFSTDIVHTHVRLGRSFEQGKVVGAFAYSRLNDDPRHSLTETGTSISGTRAGSGSVTQETTRWQLSLTWRPVRWILLHADGHRMDRSKEGSYAETRTDYPAVLNGTSSRDISANQLRTRVRFLFRKVRVDLYARYTSRDIDEKFSTAVTESAFDRDLLQDLTLTRDEWREGIRASLRLQNSARLAVKLEAYQQERETNLRDLTWGYYPGDADTNGMEGSYNLSFPSGPWQFHVQGFFQRWDRNLAPPYFDPIYDPTQLLEETAAEARVQQHMLTAATQISRTVWNARVGYVREKFSIKDPFQEFNFQPVDYDLEGILYGLGGVFNGRTWSVAWDAIFIDTKGSQSHDQIRGSVDFSKQITDKNALVVTYRFFSFDEQEFELDDYQGHFLAIGWRHQF